MEALGRTILETRRAFLALYVSPLTRTGGLSDLLNTVRKKYVESSSVVTDVCKYHLAISAEHDYDFLAVELFMKDVAHFN
jgi:hypothetical protein